MNRIDRHEVRQRGPQAIRDGRLGLRRGHKRLLDRAGAILGAATGFMSLEGADTKRKADYGTGKDRQKMSGFAPRLRK